MRVIGETALVPKRLAKVPRVLQARRDAVDHDLEGIPATRPDLVFADPVSFFIAGAFLDHDRPLAVVPGRQADRGVVAPDSPTVFEKPKLAAQRGHAIPLACEALSKNAIVPEAPFDILDATVCVRQALEHDGRPRRRDRHGGEIDEWVIQQRQGSGFDQRKLSVLCVELLEERNDAVVFDA